MKKIFSVILISLQLLTAVAFAEQAGLTEEQKTDLYNLGIMMGDENGDLRLNDNVTRAEALKMICVAGNIKPLEKGGEKPFNDVEPEHWAYKYICAAKENGVVNGDGNGNFKPEDNVTNEEIVKMTVCLLGYGETAEQSGAYPAGYTAVASRIGVTSGLNLKTNTSATRADTAVMISNALDIAIMVKNSEAGDSEDVYYVILDGKNGFPFSSLRGTRGTSAAE